MTNELQYFARLGRRKFTPTTDATKWVETWAEFIEAGGVANYNEDQTEVTLTLPEGYKFAIRFNRR